MSKIVFMGTPQFSVPILKGIVEAGHDVLFVVTQPDRKLGRGKKAVLTPTPVKKAALELGIEVLQPSKISGSEEMERLMSTEFDLIVTAAFGQFLPDSLLQHPKHGAINTHASLLPKFRGGAPIHYAILEGERETGVTIMEMVKKMDAGDIVAKKAIPIEETDDVGSMFEKLSIVGRDILLESLDGYLDGKIQPIPQDEALATYSPNITAEEEKIDWSRSQMEVFNHIRGLHPFPIAHTTWDGKRLKIQKSAKVDGKFNGEAGLVVHRSKSELF
ncbi:MAG: methionyl-tRNA formyltransferase, partial [Streptococcaceae bacterium]|nr:methionyl-tRNA formyltransferase [Streptococcaceae bacterium]